MKLGFSLQLVTVRRVGAFLEDPLDVPVVVLDFVAEQLGIADASQVKRYTERTMTRFDHQWEICRTYGLREFAAVWSAAATSTRATGCASTARAIRSKSRRYVTDAAPTSGHRLDVDAH